MVVRSCGTGPYARLIPTFLTKTCRTVTSRLSTFCNDWMGEGRAVCAEGTTTIGNNPRVRTTSTNSETGEERMSNSETGNDGKRVVTNVQNGNTSL